jgi:hypothetical protein
MGSAEKKPDHWSDVPEFSLAAWRAIFDASTEGIDVPGNCPVCHSASLHRYFHNHKPGLIIERGRRWSGSGSEWQWCSSCLSYEHTSGLVPEWWVTDIRVPESDLRHDPGPIEEARKRG